MSNKQQALIVLALFAAVLAIWFLKQNPEINRLNNLLQTDAELQAYPYHFHVLNVENGVVTLSTPRSPQVSVLQFFKIAFPHLNTSNPDSEAVIAAQKELARHQEKAHKLIKSQPGIKDVEWAIDRDWYAQHGVQVE